MNDIIPPSCSHPSQQQSSCGFPPTNGPVKYLVDIYGAAILALRLPCIFSDQLLSTFIAKQYLCFCNRHRPTPPPPPPFNDVQCTLKQIVDSLEKVCHQNELLVNGVNQITLNQSSHFLELSNMLCALRTQNCQILSCLESLKDAIICRLNKLVCEIKNVFPDQCTQINELTEKLLEAINSVQLILKNELNNTNSILNNLASSITNINSTLNNLLSAIENLSAGGGLTDEEHKNLDNIYELAKEIKGILIGVRK